MFLLPHGVTITYRPVLTVFNRLRFSIKFAHL